MSQVSGLIAEFEPRFRPMINRAGSETFRLMLGQFRTAVRRLGDVEAEVVGGLRGLLADRHHVRVILWLEAARTRPSVGLVEPLCELLSVRDSYIKHEWVAELLGEICDGRAIEALSHACSADFEGDVFRSLPKRCLEALASINTPDASKAIAAQLSSSWPEVRQKAAELLELGANEDA